MNAVDLYFDALNRADGYLRRALEGLTYDELRLQPGGEGSNPIGWIVWHMTWVRDFITAGVTGERPLWETDGWAERFGMEAPPPRFTPDNVHTFDPKDPETLIGFDLMLALVFGLLLFSVSARDSQALPGVFDALQFLLLAAAIVADLIALSAIAGRISEFGFNPNRVAALGENLVLLVNLAWSAWLYARFLRGWGEFSALVHWQAHYLPVYAVWAAVVVVVFPPLFGYV